MLEEVTFIGSSHWASCRGRKKEVKSASSSFSPSPTPCCFNTLASRAGWAMGEGRVRASRLARSLTLVRWSQMGSLLHAIFGPVLHNRFVSSCWIRQTGTRREKEARLPGSQHEDDSLSPLPLSSSFLPPVSRSITTRPVPFLSPPSRSSHGRSLHRHGEAKNSSRGVARSGRTQ